MPSPWSFAYGCPDTSSGRGDHPMHTPFVEAPEKSRRDESGNGRAPGMPLIQEAADRPGIRVIAPTETATNPRSKERTVVELKALSCFYASFRAVRDVSIEIGAREVTALIGPSYRTEGRLEFEGQDLYGPGVDPVAVRRRIGMVFQKPNPFPKSIYDNVAFGPRVNGYKGKMDELVEQSLRRAALWDDVKDKLKQSGMALSGGQQQRLCIARTIAVEPEVILMDEPCSALDPRSTLQIEELIVELKRDYTIVIVTHNMQQAARASDRTVFLTMDDDRAGYVVEVGDTARIFTNPRERLTEDYISGRFG